jgi:hypothetical protein
MMFAYEDLSDAQFETLVVFLCQKLFGIGEATRLPVVGY